MPRHLALTLLILAVLGALLVPATGVAQPAGFVDEVILPPGSIRMPTAFAFLPNGDMLIAARAGQLRLLSGGQLRAAPVFDRAGDICENGERGLLGVAVDPAFTSNRYVYVYYTFDQANTRETDAEDCPTNTADQPANRVSRLTLTAGLTTAAETVLLDNIPSPNSNHNGGDVHIGKDGHLYISVGDGGRNNDLARFRNELGGSILRITTDGGIPTDNPYTGSGTARCYDRAPGGNKSGTVAENLICQEIFAYGLRNPFRIAFDPNVPTTSFYINDVGQNSVEEISQSAPGADYGWDCYEGTLLFKDSGVCNPLPQGTVPPLFEYQRPAPAGQSAIFSGCRSITGGAFVPDGLWPATYEGAYFFADIGCARIFGLRNNGGTLVPEQLRDNRGVTHMAFGPRGATQALYYTDFSQGAIRALRYTGNANRAPVAAIALGAPSATPRTLTFDASRSSDAEGAIAAYLWDFGDGQTAETTTPSISHTYAAAGTYTITLRVRDAQDEPSFRPATLRTAVRDPVGGGDVRYLPFVGR